MKKVLLWLMLGFFLQACSSDSPLKEDPTDVEKYKPGTIEYLFFVELGLKPSQIDSINYIKSHVEEKDYSLLLGRRNNRAWLSKFDKSGEEIYSYELTASNKWKYSHYSQNSLVLNDNKYLFLRGWASDVSNIGDSYQMYDCDEYLSIIDFKTGEELELFKPVHLHGDYVYNTTINISNGRYLIRCDGLFTDEYDSFYVVGEDGKERYGRKWTENERRFFKNKGYIFIDDERVIQGVKEPFKINMGSSFSISIINLKEWKLLKKYNSENGLEPKGDHFEEKNVYYYVDSTYLEGENIKLIYDEVLIEKDEISETESQKVLNKYVYSINTDTYEIVFEGKK